MITAEDIRKSIKDNGIYMWEVAKMLGIHESTLQKWFHYDLSATQKMKLIAAIEEIKLKRMTTPIPPNDTV